jgi:hypothetical protein
MQNTSSDAIASWGDLLARLRGAEDFEEMHGRVTSLQNEGYTHVSLDGTTDALHLDQITVCVTELQKLAASDIPFDEVWSSTSAEVTPNYSFFSNLLHPTYRDEMWLIIRDAYDGALDNAHSTSTDADEQAS